MCIMSHWKRLSVKFVSKFVIDIDGTICEQPIGVDDYAAAVPIPDRIRHVNLLHDAGHTIVYFTARGMGRTEGKTAEAYELFYELTKSQLAEWGAKHHELILGKPAGDVYIDDKGTNATSFFEVSSFE